MKNKGIYEEPKMEVLCLHAERILFESGDGFAGEEEPLPEKTVSLPKVGF